MSLLLEKKEKAKANLDSIASVAAVLFRDNSPAKQHRQRMFVPLDFPTKKRLKAMVLELLKTAKQTV